MSSGPQFRPGITPQERAMSGSAPAQPSQFELAAANSLRETVRAALADELIPLIQNLSGAGDSAGGVQDGLDSWQKMASILDRGSGADPTLGPDPSLGQIFGLTGFADFHSPVVQEIFGDLVQAEKSLVIPMFPPYGNYKNNQPMSFYDLAHSKEVEINFPQEYFINCYSQAKHDDWNWGPLKNDSRLPKPTDIGGYHDWAETDFNIGLKVPTGLSWSCSRNGHDNWSVSQGDYIISYGYGLVHHAGGPPKGDIYVKGSGDQMATWLFQQSGMADKFLAILKPQS